MTMLGRVGLVVCFGLLGGSAHGSQLPTRCPLSAAVPVGRAKVAVVDSGIASLPDLDGVVDRAGSRNLIAGENPTDLTDRDGHGTAMAAVIHRVAPHARLLVLKVLDDRGGGLPRAVAAAVRHAVDQGATVINLSASGLLGDADVRAALTEAAHAGVVVVMAAGNDARDLDHHPDWMAVRGLDDLLVVAASDGKGQLAAGTNWGPATVDIAAPGRDVLSRSIVGEPTRVSGSSPAAAAVTGTAASLQESNPGLVGPKLATAVRAESKPVKSLERRVRYGELDDRACVGAPAR